MSRWSFVNGAFVRTSSACVSIQDRGFQFADSIYEVCAAFNGRILDLDLHLDRLERSLAAIGMPMPCTRAVVSGRFRQILSVNRLREALVYLQVTRGTAPRDHAFPTPGSMPTVVLMAKPLDVAAKISLGLHGVTVSTRADIRWQRRDIKTTALLPNVLAKQAARAAGDFESWFVDGKGVVTEGASTNAWIVDSAGALITHPDGCEILPGIMKGTLIRLARARQIPVIERAFSRGEALSASEAFLTATTAPCLPVIKIDGTDIGTGKPGPMAAMLQESLAEEIWRQTGFAFPHLLARCRQAESGQRS